MRMNTRSSLGWMFSWCFTVSALAACPAQEPKQAPAEKDLPVILLTGFEPFGRERLPNPSYEAIDDLHFKQFNGYRLVSTQLKVVWGAPLKELQQLMADTRPVAVFSFGQGGASGFALETRASNRRGASFDNNQQLPTEPLIVADGPEQFAASTNCQALWEKLAEAGYPVRLSSNAGRYLCEECLYSLEYLKVKNQFAGQVMFCHVPPLGARVAGRVVDVEYVQQFVLDLLNAWLALYQANPPAQRAQQPEDAKTAEVRQFVESYFRTWSNRQMDAYADCFHSEAVIQFID